MVKDIKSLGRSNCVILFSSTYYRKRIWNYRHKCILDFKRSYFSYIREVLTRNPFKTNRRHACWEYQKRKRQKIQIQFQLKDRQTDTHTQRETWYLGNHWSALETFDLTKRDTSRKWKMDIIAEEKYEQGSNVWRKIELLNSKEQKQWKLKATKWDLFRFDSSKRRGQSELL